MKTQRITGARINLLQYYVDDGGNKVSRDLNAADFLDMLLDLTSYDIAHIHADDLAFGGYLITFIRLPPAGLQTKG